MQGLFVSRGACFASRGVCFASHGACFPARSPSRDCTQAGSGSAPRGEQRWVPGAAFMPGINLNSN